MDYLSFTRHMVRQVMKGLFAFRKQGQLSKQCLAVRTNLWKEGVISVVDTTEGSLRLSNLL